MVTYELGLHVDGGRAKKRWGLDGLGLVAPPLVPVRSIGRLGLLFFVIKVTCRAGVKLMVVMVVGVAWG